MPPATAAPSQTKRPMPWIGWGLVFTSAMMLYYFTCAREVQWQDSGQFVMRIAKGELADRFGLALVHPLHFWIGRVAVRLLPVKPAFAVPLVSALFGALTVANVFGIVMQLTRRIPAALFAAAGLALAHTFWHMSTTAEVYTISAMFLTAEVWTLLLWDKTGRPAWLIAAFAMNGLGLADHNLALLTLPVVGIALLSAIWGRQVGWRTFVLAGVVWCIGAGLFLGLVVQQAWETGQVGQTIHSALFGDYQRSVIGSARALRFAAVSMAFTLLSFPNLVLPLALMGAVRGRLAGLSRFARRVLLADLAMHLLFVLRYDVIDQYTFLVPAYALVAILAGIGLNNIVTRWPRRLASPILALACVLVCLDPLTYLLAEHAARRFGVLGELARDKPYRDDYRYLFSAWGRGEGSAARLSREAARLAGNDGVLVVEDELASFAIKYELFEEGKTGVEVCLRDDSPLIDEARRARRRVVLVPLRANLLPIDPPDGRWEPIGALYILRSDRDRAAPNLGRKDR
jgi:hypothetical protein